MSSRLVRINVKYDYCSHKRITPLYISEDELLEFSFESFKERIVEEISYLQKLNASSLRFTVMEDENTEVDFSFLYFNVQLEGLLTKGKDLSVNVMAFNSP